jgi:Domain of unknown function (DUF4926)
MEPEEMDVVELLADVPVDPDWAHDRDIRLSVLNRGERGMVVHRDEGSPPRYTVEFLDLSNGQLRALAILGGDQIRVVERNTLGGA